MTTVKILGFIKAIHSSSTPPTNTQMLWYDTNVNLHKYWSTVGSSWTPLTAGGATWATTLASNPNTGATNPHIDPGQAIEFENSGFVTTFETATLTNNRILQLPDKSDTIATISDIAAAVGLAPTLALANTTGGTDIIMSDLDKIKAASGTVFIDLKDGGTAGDARFEASGNMTLQAVNNKLLGITTATVTAPTVTILSDTNQVVVDGKTRIDFKVNGIDVALIDGKGLSVGTTSSPGSISANNVALFSKTAVEIAIQKATAADTGILGFYHSTTKGASIGTDTANNLEIKTLLSGDDIEFLVNDTNNVSSFVATDRTFHTIENFSYEPDLRTNPAGVTISVSNVSCIEFNTGMSSYNLDEMTGYFAGKMVRIVNTGVGNLNIRHNFVGTAGKIFTPTGAAYVLGPDQGIIFHYSANKGAWYFLTGNN